MRAVADGEEALETLDGIDLVLLDQNLPGRSGVELLGDIQAMPAHPSVIMVTGAGSEELVVESMRAGAIDYVVKDSDYLQTLPRVVQRAWRHHDLMQRADQLQRLSLLITSSLDREHVLGEIVAGARSLLRTDGCAVALLEASGMTIASSSGRGVEELVDLDLARAMVTNNDPFGDAETNSHCRLVPLLAPSGFVLGTLALLSIEARLFSDDELSLARTFASFAGIALQNVERFETEQAVVAELQRAVEIRRKFVGSVSHELRTPLSIIYGFSETLVNQWDNLLEDQRLDITKRITHHSGELRNIVEQLLDFAVLEKGRITATLAPLHLAKEVTASVERLSHVLDDRTVELTLVDVEVMADPSLLQRTLINLISNAVKYSDAETPIHVTVSRSSSTALVEVIDQGSGLAPEDVENVFEPFWRAGQPGIQAVRGVGLGLSLVAEYVRAMGGKPGVRSEVGKGSTFYFTLQLVDGERSGATSDGGSAVEESPQPGVVHL